MSNSKIEPWKLTAFLLNELDSEEAQLVRTLIEADSELGKEVESLRATLDRARQALIKSHGQIALDDARVTTIAKNIEGKPESNRWKWQAIAALAASLLLAAVLLPTGWQNSMIALQSNSDSQRSKLPLGNSPALGDLDPATTSASSDLLPKDEASGSHADTSSPASETASTALAARPYGDVYLGTQYNELAVNLPEKSNMLPERELSELQSTPIVIEQERVAAGDLASSDLMDRIALRDKSALPSETSVEKEHLFAAASPPPPAIAPSASPSSGEAAQGRRSFGMGGGLPSPSGPYLSDPSAQSLPTINAPQVALGVTSELPRDLSKDEGLVDGKDADDFRYRSLTMRVPGNKEPREENEKQLHRREIADRFEAVGESRFSVVQDEPLSTFSIDVDTASYSKTRQYLMQSNTMPNPASVRIEELINYFDYDYAGPKDEHPFASNMAVGVCPWNEKHRLIRIGLQAKKVEVADRPKANLVFLLDVSGSMDEPNKLPLVKQSIALLAKQLGENDRIGIVVYAGAAGCVLPSITGDHQEEILSALDQLQAGGSTNGGEGIELAYSIARDHFVPGGINRIILCTDGDFNVGTTSTEGLVELVERNAKSRIFLTCLGYGIGNYNDAMMEQITNRGNGTYGMVDNIREARRLMIEQLSGTLMTVAKDVKIQVEFNPAKVSRYRLIGYENRRLANADFNNDAKDAGEIGAGHRVTALYEVVPANVIFEPAVDELRYRKNRRSESSVEGKSQIQASEHSSEWMTLKLRYKQPEGDVSTKLDFYLMDRDAEANSNEVDFQWAASVAEFGLLLRRSQMAPQADWERMIRRAQASAKDDPYRLECIEMMIKAHALAR